jgi:hypothetical protein
MRISRFRPYILVNSKVFDLPQAPAQLYRFQEFRIMQMTRPVTDIQDIAGPVNLRAKALRILAPHTLENPSRLSAYLGNDER